MTKILINKCNDILRPYRKDNGAKEVNENAYFLERYENIEWLETLKSLDEKYRLVMVLYYVDGLSGENGQPIISTLYREPPVLTGVRLKDGTLLVGICNGGMTSWEDLEKGIYRETFATSRVIDTEKVDALLYLKPGGNGETMFAEENLYIVPVE